MARYQDPYAVTVEKASVPELRSLESPRVRAKAWSDVGPPKPPAPHPVAPGPNVFLAELALKKRRAPAVGEETARCLAPPAPGPSVRFAEGAQAAHRESSSSSASSTTTPPKRSPPGPSDATSPMLAERKQQTKELRKKRESLSPEQKRRLMQNEEHVMGAALSLHVIHDVALDEIDGRLEASGVDDSIRFRAIETIKKKLAEKEKVGTFPVQLCFDEDELARLAVGAPLRRRIRDMAPAQGVAQTIPKIFDLPNPDDEKVAKFNKMVKCGVPVEGAVAAAVREGITDPRLHGLIRGDAAATSAAAAPPQPKEDALGKYKKMLSRGVPKPAVKGLMEREGRSADEIAKVVGDDENKKDAAAATTGKTANKAGGGKGMPTPRRVKTLHWEKLEGDVSQTIWASPAQTEKKALEKKKPRSRPSLDGPLVGDDDLALLEEVFATAPPPKKAPKSVRKNLQSVEVDNDQGTLKKVTILKDSRRAANVGIGLSYFSRRFGDDDGALCRALIGMDDWFDAERLRSLTVLLPTAEETALIEAYCAEHREVSGGVDLADETLARPERFFRATRRWPDLVETINAALLRSEVEETVWETKSSMRAVTRACDAVKESTSLALVMRTLLKLGNRLNDGVGHLSGAHGVTLASLSRIAMAKGRDDTSLMDYLVDLLAKKHQEKHLDFVDALPSLDEAKRNVDDEKSAGAIRRLKQQLQSMKTLLPKMAKLLQASDKPAAAAECAAMAQHDAPKRRAKASTTSSSFGFKKKASAVSSANPSATAAHDRAALHRFVVEAERTIGKSTVAISQLDKQLVKCATSKQELLAYFGEDGDKGDLTKVFASLAVFVREVRGARDKLHRRYEREDRLRRASEQKSLRDVTKRNSAPGDFVQLRSSNNNNNNNNNNAASSSRRAKDFAKPTVEHVQLRSTNHGRAASLPPSRVVRAALKPANHSGADEPAELIKPANLASANLRSASGANHQGSASSLSLSKCRNTLKMKHKKESELAKLTGEDYMASAAKNSAPPATSWSFSSSLFS